MPIKINDIPSGEFTLAIQITSRIKIFIGYRLVAYKPSIRIKVTFGKVGYTLCELFFKKKRLYVKSKRQDGNVISSLEKRQLHSEILNN